MRMILHPLLYTGRTQWRFLHLSTKAFGEQLHTDNNNKNSEVKNIEIKQTPNLQSVNKDSNMDTPGNKKMKQNKIKTVKLNQHMNQSQ